MKTVPYFINQLPEPFKTEGLDYLSKNIYVSNLDCSYMSEAIMHIHWLYMVGDRCNAWRDLYVKIKGEENDKNTKKDWLNTEMEISYVETNGNVFINSAFIYINGAMINITDNVKSELTKMINNDIPNS
jgi:hypothetical protein